MGATMTVSAANRIGPADAGVLIEEPVQGLAGGIVLRHHLIAGQAGIREETGRQRRIGDIIDHQVRHLIQHLGNMAAVEPDLFFSPAGAAGHQPKKE